jgi:hypothetical protein
MKVHIELGDRTATFTLDLETMDWTSEDAPDESDFPLTAMVEGKRYELYSDGSLAEVELGR